MKTKHEKKLAIYREEMTKPHPSTSHREALYNCYSRYIDTGNYPYKYIRQIAEMLETNNRWINRNNQKYMEFLHE